ncbi:hypothetical protein K402DRAFT_404450 [Aulographum hederae CBS 113979]|uniref:SCP domain-containing protein n=1 Tax=Aulographum hederae CBS 113979 TaxID=1176131 RepID=A0A6G1GZY8_9PEZI|nr:hypothetical protein K402DRAFT_404450 [Aulographum hederae CBS 113979]
MLFSKTLPLFVVGAAASPIWNILVPKAVVTVTDVAVVYETITAGQEPVASPTPSPAAEAETTSADRSWSWGQWNGWHHDEPASSTTKAVVTTSSVAPPPPPPSTTSTPPPPPPSTTVAPTTTSTPPPPPPPETTSTTQAPTTTSKAAPVATSAAPSTGSDDGSPMNGGKSVLSIVNKWRSTQAGCGHFTWDSQLAKNALKTGVDGGGVNQVHQLNAGSYAQVITPGMEKAGDFDLKGDTPFELSYTAWLCEAPTSALTGASPDQCTLVNDVLHMSYSGTGHSDILTSKDYKTIGCAFAPNPNADPTSPYQGLWVCDLGM